MLHNRNNTIESLSGITNTCVIEKRLNFDMNLFASDLVDVRLSFEDVKLSTQSALKLKVFCGLFLHNMPCC